MPLGALLMALALAAGSVEEDPRFREGRRLFEAFDLDGALARFRLLSLDSALSDDDRARVLLWRGLTEAELGRFHDAEITFEEAFVHDADAVIPSDASPKVVQMAEGARKRVAARPPPEPTRPEVATTDDGAVHPAGPGVLIKTTATGRMDAEVQEKPTVDEPVEPAPSGGVPWLLVAGGAGGALGVVVVAGGGVLGVLALLDHEGARAAPSAKDASELSARAELEALGANIGFGAGGLLVVVGAAVALAGLVVDGE